MTREELENIAAALAALITTLHGPERDAAMRAARAVAEALKLTRPELHTPTFLLACRVVLRSGRWEVI